MKSDSRALLDAATAIPKLTLLFKAIGARVIAEGERSIFVRLPDHPAGPRGAKISGPHAGPGGGTWRLSVYHLHKSGALAGYTRSAQPAFRADAILLDLLMLGCGLTAADAQSTIENLT